MNENAQELTSVFERVDLYSILRDLLRSLWAILLGAAAAAMITYMVTDARFQTTYSTKATFVVTSRTASTHTYSNLSAAATMADSFTNILNSNLLKKKVCQDLGIPSFNARATASVVSETNLLNLNVSADSPQSAYKVIRSIMNVMADLTPYVSQDMIMDVLQQPGVPTRADAASPARRQATRVFALAFAALCAAFVYLSWRKETIRSERELEEMLDARSLGVLSYNRKYRSLKAFLQRKEDRLLVTEMSARFEFVESFRKLAARLTGTLQDLGGKVILVTSVTEHEGKSTVSANLALTLAKQNEKSRVLLIDGDLRRPSLQKLLFKTREKGSGELGALLSGELSLNEALRYDKARRLYVLLSDRDFENSTDLVSSPRMGKVLEAARKYFDYIVIDTPPLSMMADAEVLAGQADVSMLVVSYDTVPARDINDAIDQLKTCRAHFAGCVLNGVHRLPFTGRTVVGYGTYGRYGHYGHYGRYGKYGRYGAYGGYGAYGKDRKETEEKA